MAELPNNQLNASSAEDDEDDGDSLLPVPWVIVAVVCVTVAMATAVGGNVLVLLSYHRDRLLRNVHNLYLLNLAVSDLFIGAVSMPFYLVYTVLRWTWPFGPALCKVFLVEDFTMCAMSTLVVVLVAWDRLALVQNGASYSAVETRRKACVKLAVCWAFSFLLYSPAILLWDVVVGQSVVPSDDCDVEFNGHFEFTLVTEVVAFAVPFLSLAVINTLLFLTLQKGSKVSAHNAAGVRQGVTQPNHQRTQAAFAPQSSLVTRETKLGPSLSLARPNTIQDGAAATESASQPRQKATDSTSSHNDKAKTHRNGRSRRAGLILALLILALVIFWLPYSLTTVILAACDSCVNKDLYEFFNWFLWLKSCVNPFLYAYNSPRFRKNFTDLLSPVLRCRRERQTSQQQCSIQTVSW